MSDGVIPLPEDPAFAPDATVEVRDLSVWFGPKVALSELSCSFGPGVTGLLDEMRISSTALSPSALDAYASCGQCTGATAASACGPGCALTPECSNADVCLCR